MKSTKLVPVVLAAALLTGTSLRAADMTDPQNATSAPQVQMVSGGIGDGELDALRQAQHDYSVKLVYAMTNGEYVSDVNMKVTDAEQNTLVNSSDVGPIVLLNLKPGNYTLVSTVAGDTKTQRISVRDDKLSTYIIHLNSKDS